MIYGLIEQDDYSAIKIGYTRTRSTKIDIEAALHRARCIQVGNRRDLYLVAADHGNAEEETRLHRWFCDRRLTGEWFSLDGAVRAWYERVALPTPIRARLDADDVDSQARPRRNIEHGERRREIAAGISSLTRESRREQGTRRVRDEPIENQLATWMWRGRARIA